MDTFHWDKNFVTGLTEVDHQHQHLVELINRFGNYIADNNPEYDYMEEVFKKLAEYTQFHFKEEEGLMIQIGVDKRHIDHHIEAHSQFIEEVVALHAGISPDNPDSTKHLLDFLTHWLAYHILGSDQNMARQINAIQSGLSPSDAYVKEELEVTSSTEPLLVALNGLFHQVSMRNRELIQLNQSLEEKVKERTKELSEANHHLEELSLTDVLTALPNRRHAMRRLETLWAESSKDHSPLVCMMIDADHFKEVNDTYGHDSGDLVLRELSITLQHSVRNDDIVCRLGGDEFLIICPNTNIQGGMQVAELTRKRVSELKVATGDGFWNSSISIGVAARSPSMTHHEELIKVADESVYAAKRDGKNCVRTKS